MWAHWMPSLSYSSCQPNMGGKTRTHSHSNMHLCVVCFTDVYITAILVTIQDCASGVGRLWANKALEGQAIVHKQSLAPPMLCLLRGFRRSWIVQHLVSLLCTFQWELNLQRIVPLHKRNTIAKCTTAQQWCHNKFALRIMWICKINYLMLHEIMPMTGWFW